MLYTRKGDDGKTSAYHCDQRFSKSSAIAEALGSLDETNSFLGIVKAKLAERNITLYSVGPERAADIIQEMQENLFIIQAEVAGALARMTDIRSGGDKTVGEEKIREAEDLIAGIEKEIPPITSFIIPGVSTESAELDFARTLVRQAERRVVAVSEEGLAKVSANTLAYLNRLSSLLFALARLSAYKSGIEENSPSYK
jgi:cob(I)alamin adenosyltransferase